MCKQREKESESVCEHTHGESMCVRTQRGRECKEMCTNCVCVCERERESKEVCANWERERAKNFVQKERGGLRKCVRTERTRKCVQTEREKKVCEQEKE